MCWIRNRICRLFFYYYDYCHAIFISACLIFFFLIFFGTRFSVEVTCPSVTDQPTGCSSANSSCNQDMDSSSSSISSTSSLSYLSYRQGEDGREGEQSKQPPLFFIKPIDSQGQGIGKKRLEDLGGYYNLEFKLLHMAVCI